MVKQVFSDKFCSAFALLLMLLVYSAVSMAANITVQADRNPVSLNESFKLVYKSDGSVDDDPDFSPLEKELDILSRSQSSNMSIINGSYSSTKTWTLTVMAKQAGTLTLPPISFGSDQAPSYSLKVKQASQQSPQQSLFFSRLEVDRQQVYAQQQLVLTQKLFSARNLSAFGMAEPDFSSADVVVHQLGDEKQYQTRVGERQYLVVERRYAIFAQADGLLKVNPVLAEGRLASGRSSIFDSFGGGEVVRTRSNALSVAVLPLPKNAGAGPWLPARQLQLQEQWSQNPPRFTVGEPLTRTLSIKAEGLTAAQLPEIPPLQADGWKQYPDQPMLNNIDNDDGVTGYRVEKIALIPTRAGELTLPAIEIKWWNTQTRSFEVASIPQRKVQVAPAKVGSQAATAQPRTAPPVTKAPAASDLEDAVAETGADAVSTEKGTLDVDSIQSWQWIAAALALAWALTLLGWWLFARRQSAAPKPGTAATQVRTDVIKPLRAACQQQDLGAFRQALLQWGEVQFELQPATLQQIAERLSPAAATEIRKIDAALYAAAKSSPDCKLLVREIEQIEASNRSGKRPQKGAGLEPLYR